MPIKIEPMPNGPILLNSTEGDLPPLRTPDGKDIEPGAKTALCRCGESNNKPFCDGSHGAAGFTDENRCDRDSLKTVEAPDVTVHFNRAICSGAGECVRGLPAVFVSGAEDWIRPAEADAEAVIATVKRCPSGALTYTVDGETHRRVEPEVTFRIVKDGPYEVTGPVEFEPENWCENASRTCFTLCRCGKTDNAPFCDYSHGEKGWKDE